MHEKEQVIGNVFGVTFQTPSDWISHRIHIVRTSCSQFPAIAGIFFCLLAEFIYAKYFFLSCPRYCGQGLTVVIVYYFQICNPKEHNIIIRRDMSCHRVPCILRHPVFIQKWTKMRSKLWKILYQLTQHRIYLEFFRKDKIKKSSLPRILKQSLKKIDIFHLFIWKIILFIKELIKSKNPLAYCQ